MSEVILFSVSAGAVLGLSIEKAESKRLSLALLWTAHITIRKHTQAVLPM